MVGHRWSAWPPGYRAVIADLHTTVFQEADIDLGREAGHGLVDRVVDDLPDQMVQASLTGRADIHTRSFADRLEPFEDFDGFGTVLIVGSH